jgi:hypothetical protein
LPFVSGAVRGRFVLMRFFLKESYTGNVAISGGRSMCFFLDLPEGDIAIGEV